ncbi:MAG: hypothetical protein H0T46_17170 [Deltaproteobacteria bacterium]|nr:hypothetical protein [Deltaproteobacteria bacterium]
MGRALLLASLLIAGCSSRQANSPAWPKMAERETDGGESIAPRAGAVVIAAAKDEAANDDDSNVVVTPAAEKPAASATPAKDEKPSAAAATVTAPEETITIDDIVIEIED